RVAQIPEARVAGAEVVDVQPDAGLAEGVETDATARKAVGERRLGNLQGEQRGGESALREGGAHRGEEVGVLEFPGGQVDGQAEGLAGPLAVEGGDVLHRMAYHVLADLGDEVGVGDGGDEF